MTRGHLLASALIPIAYVIGSIPFGLMVGKSRGVDPRTAGSGNIGATNVGRLLGKRFFAIVFTLDLLKGLIPVVLAGWLLRTPAMTAVDYALWLTAGFAAILGHLFSVFLRFKGGKGVATSAGVMFGVFPFYTLPAIVGAAAWIGVFKTTRYVSVASMLAAGMFVVAYVAFGIMMRWPMVGDQWPLLAFAVAIAVLIVVKHRSNIARLRAGTEHRFGKGAASNV